MPRHPFRGNRLVETSTQVDRGAALVARHNAHYWCANDHLTTVPFAADVEPPGQWLCYSCGTPAGPDRGAAPDAVQPRVFPRTPYEFLMMRRSQADAERLLSEALEDLRRRRGEKP